jgi:predicted RNA-binding Zn-ribbon protein involved in translation (DUF1610 family)
MFQFRQEAKLTMTRHVAHADWVKQAEAKFGLNAHDWAFKCPSCGHVATVRQYKAAGASEGQVGFNCIGRHTGGKDVVKIFESDKGQGCNYTQGGLFTLARTLIDMPNGREIPVFEFAKRPQP